jgi:hypothetical protein
VVTLNFISSLDSNVKSGGAYLRISAIRRIYEHLGYKVNDYYNDQPSNQFSLAPYLQTLIYGKNPRILLKKRKLSVESAPIVHLDNLRQFNWTLDGQDHSAFKIYNAHNLEFENFYGREDSQYKSRFIQYEIEKMMESDLTMVCSERERSILIATEPKLRDKIVTVPNLIDKDNYKSASHDQKKVILFIGTLDYFPNEVAIDYLCSKFNSYITQEHLNEYEFVIAGRNPTKESIAKIEKSHFKLRQDLSHEEVSELFARTYLHLVPLTHGSGTRLKIVEALITNGLVLSTPLGREGIQSQNIVDSPIESFHDDFVKFMNENREFDQGERAEILKNWDIDTWFNENKELLQSKLPK